MFVDDVAKGYNDNVFTSEMDAYFISVNVQTNVDGRQEIENITDICSKIRNCNKTAYIWIRSTITPSTFRLLDERFHVNYMPEFLSENTAIDDFARIPIVYTPSDRTDELELLCRIFNGREGMETTSIEAIHAKYFHNIFGALKVTYFNCIYDMCLRHSLDFDTVKKAMMVPGHISELYTKVPGPDGKLGYGGKCFPKDTIAFINDNRGSILNSLIDNMPKINESLRNEND